MHLETPRVVPTCRVVYIHTHTHMAVDDIVTLELILFTIAIVFWPPYILMHFSNKDVAWYAGLSSLVMFAPRYWVFMFLWLFGLALLASSALLHMVSTVGYAIPDAEFLASTVLFFVLITLVHYLLKVIFRYRAPIAAMVTTLLALLTAIAVTVLYAVEGYWLEFGLMIAYCVWLLMVMFMTINWYLCKAACEHGKMHATPSVIRTSAHQIETGRGFPVNMLYSQ